MRCIDDRCLLISFLQVWFCALYGTYFRLLLHGSRGKVELWTFMNSVGETYLLRMLIHIIQCFRCNDLVTCHHLHHIRSPGSLCVLVSSSLSCYEVCSHKFDCIRWVMISLHVTLFPLDTGPLAWQVIRKFHTFKIWNAFHH